MGAVSSCGTEEVGPRSASLDNLQDSLQVALTASAGAQNTEKEVGADQGVDPAPARVVGAENRKDRGDVVRLEVPSTATLTNMERCFSERYNFVSWLYRIRNNTRSHRFGFLQPSFIYCVLGPMMGAGFDGKLMSTLHCGSSVYNLVADKDRVYSGCYDCTIRVWNPIDETCVQSITKLTDAVECMAMHGGRLYCGTADSTITVWVNKAAERAANRLETLSDSVGFPTPPPSASGEVDAAEIAKCDKQWVLMWSYKQRHEGYITCMSFHDVSFYSGSFAHDILVFRVSDYSPVATLRGHSAGVNCLLHDGLRLFSGSYDKTIRVWDCVTHQPIATIIGHKGFVYNMQIHGDLLFSGGGGSDDNAIRVWNTKTLEPAGTSTLSGHKGICYCMAIAKDLNKLYTGSEDRTIRVWRINEKKGGSVLFSGSLTQHKNGVVAPAHF